MPHIQTDDFVKDGAAIGWNGHFSSPNYTFSTGTLPDSVIHDLSTPWQTSPPNEFQEDMDLEELSADLGGPSSPCRELNEKLECLYWRSVSLADPNDINTDQIRCFTELRWNERDTVQTYMADTKYDFIYDNFLFQFLNLN